MPHKLNEVCMTCGLFDSNLDKQKDFQIEDINILDMMPEAITQSITNVI